MRIARAALLSLGLAAMAADPAMAQRCRAPSRAPQVTIVAAPGELIFNHSLDDIP